MNPEQKKRVNAQLRAMLAAPQGPTKRERELVERLATGLEKRQ